MRNKPLPKKVLERMTHRAALLYAKMRAEDGWSAQTAKERNVRFSSMLSDVLREFKIPSDEWGIYKSTLGVWLQKRGKKKRDRSHAESAYYAETFPDNAAADAATGFGVEDEDALISHERTAGYGYPCIDYIHPFC